MSNKEQTPRPSNVRNLLILVIVAIIGATGWYVLKSKDNTDKTLNDAKAVQNTENKSKETPDPYKGWKSYTWTSQATSFKYPGGWFVNEDQKLDRLYVKNSQVDLLKEETPENFQQIWFSADSGEASVERENAIKNGNSDYRVVSSAVKASTVKAGSITINVYEYDTVGGPTAEAYWTNKAGQRLFATNSTEVGQQNQQDMVANLKKVLATVAYAE